VNGPLRYPDDRRRLMARFSVVFLALILAFTGASSSGVAGRYLHEPLIRIIAWMTATLLSTLGQVESSGPFIQFQDFQVQVVEACDGVLPTYIYLAAVLAFPSRWAAKAWGVLIGVPAIFLINLARMSSLMLLGAWRPELFEKVHIYVWQALVIAFSMALWVFWAERFVRPRPRTRT